jgi:uncharacterized membrane protein
MAEAVLAFLEEVINTTGYGRYAVVFIMSMLPAVSGPPIVIPIGMMLGLPLIPTAIATVLGNIFPVPFIILFIRKIFMLMRKYSDFLGKLADKYEEKAKARGVRFQYGMFLGLLLFVAVPLPLPGMGAWTGALIAALFNVRLKIALPAIAIGVLIAGTITTVTLYGVITLVF